MQLNDYEQDLVDAYVKYKMVGGCVSISITLQELDAIMSPDINSQVKYGYASSYRYSSNPLKEPAMMVEHFWVERNGQVRDLIGYVNSILYSQGGTRDHLISPGRQQARLIWEKEYKDRLYSIEPLVNHVLDRGAQGDTVLKSYKQLIDNGMNYWDHCPPHAEVKQIRDHLIQKYTHIKQSQDKNNNKTETIITNGAIISTPPKWTNASIYYPSTTTRVIKKKKTGY